MVRDARHRREPRQAGLLWETRLGTSAQGFPVTFRAGGEQYIAVAAGVGGGSLRRVPTLLSPEIHYPATGDASFVFKLMGAPRPLRRSSSAVIGTYPLTR